MSTPAEALRNLAEDTSLYLEDVPLPLGTSGRKLIAIRCATDRLRLMKRVVVLGRGGSGKSTFSRRLGIAAGLPVIELDKLYWDETLTALDPEEWGRRQSEVASRECWILDGDMGPHDVLAPRLTRADTVVIVDTPLATCIWRAMRRGRQRVDFWVWVLRWRHTYLPRILDEVRRHAPSAELVRLSRSSSVDRFFASPINDH